MPPSPFSIYILYNIICLPSWELCLFLYLFVYIIYIYIYIHAMCLCLCAVDPSTLVEKYTHLRTLLIPSYIYIYAGWFINLTAIISCYYFLNQFLYFKVKIFLIIITLYFYIQINIFIALLYHSYNFIFMCVCTYVLFLLS